MRSIARIASSIAAKDLRVEWRSRVVTNQVLPFAALVMVLFAFALDDDGITERVAPGLVWLAVLFSLVILVTRSYAIETADGALDQLRSSGVDPVGIFLGKAVALAVQLLVLEAVLAGLAVVLYRASIGAEGLALFVSAALLATLGLAAVGTLYGGLAAGVRGRETLLPLLVLPVLAPVLIAATRCTESAFGLEGVDVSDGWPWLGLLAIFAVLFSVFGAFAYGPLIDE